MTALLSLFGFVLLASIIISHRTLARALARREPPRPAPEHYPSVTVVRPVRGADVGAAENFQAALDTGYPGDVETLFVFDTYDDPGLPIARAVVARHRRLGRAGSADVLVAGAPPAGRTGKLNAMMYGCASARGELVGFGDSDTRPDHQVLRIIVETLLARPRAGCAFAPVLVDQPPRAGGDVAYAIMLNALYSPQAAWVAGPERVLPFIMGQLMVFRREALDAIGGIGAADGQLVDDMYLGRCVQAAGWENVMTTHPLCIATGGMTILQFLPVYRRWLMFGRSGLTLALTWRPWLLGLAFYLSLAGMIAAYSTGSWAAFLPHAATFVAVGVSQLLLHRDFGGAAVPVRLMWACWMVFALAPAVAATTFLHRSVDWRGRKYELDATAALAAHPT